MARARENGAEDRRVYEVTIEFCTSSNMCVLHHRGAPNWKLYLHEERPCAFTFTQTSSSPV